MFRECINLLKKSGRTLVLFEIGIQVLTFAAIVPLVGLIIDCAINLAGLKYLTNANISQLLKSVWTLPMFALIALIAAVQILLNFTGVIACFKAAAQNRRLSFGQLIYELTSSIKRMFSSGTGSLLLHLLLILPAISLPAAGGLISAIGMPDILSRIIPNTAMLLVVYSVAVALCFTIGIKWIISLPIYVCRHCSFRAARRQSSRLISGNTFSVLISLLLWSLGYLAAFVMMIIAVTGVGIGTLNLFGITVSYGSKSLKVIRYFLLFFVFLFSAGTVPYFAAATFSKYKTLLSKRKIISKSKSSKTFAYKNKKNRIIAVLTAMALIFADSVYIFRLASGDVSVRFLLNISPMTIAHRGYSTIAPENTEYAFIAAMQQGADGIELDVQQTSDGIPVVIHDISLKRIAGIDRKVSSYTYAELSQIDIGSWYNPQFSDARIMTLEEVIRLTDGKVFLNIELKRGAIVNHIEQKVAALIEQYGIKNKCCVTSFSYESLKRIKKCDEDIKTGLIMSIATGNFYNLDYVDAFSIKSMFISSQVVNNAHQVGKEVYAWTVNNTNEMHRMLGLNVDHIITDRPALLMEQIDKNISEYTLLDTALNLIS